MLGLGEREEEVMVAMEDLRAAGCDILTLGQYLQPTLEAFAGEGICFAGKIRRLGGAAKEMGFVHVASGPMVRSSYHADEFQSAVSPAH